MVIMDGGNGEALASLPLVKQLQLEFKAERMRLAWADGAGCSSVVPMITGPGSSQPADHASQAASICTQSATNTDVTADLANWPGCPHQLFLNDLQEQLVQWCTAGE